MTRCSERSAGKLQVLEEHADGPDTGQKPLVLPSVRGKGVGTAFVCRIRDHRKPYGPRRMLLATEDAHGVYEKAGFRPLDHPDRWMLHPLG